MYQLVLVDDERYIAEGLTNLFSWEEIGFEVKCFCSALKALDFIENHNIDVLMCDIEMPEMNGSELCGKIKDSGIKIVIFSSYQNYEYFRNAIQFKVDDYLLKPVKREDILKCFGKIKEELDTKYKLSEEKPLTYYEQIVRKVIQYIDENYKDASLESAATLVNMSPSYLSKTFKTHGEMGFSDYLTQVRMKKACELLDDIQYKMYDIAYYVGYDNPNNFTRAFKAYYGVTPKAYRNRER